MRKSTLHAIFPMVLLGAVLALPRPARSTPCYGNDEGSKYQIAATTNAGWSYHASIDAAVTAGEGAGRTTMEFLGTWTGIDETVKLRNSDLTFQGSSGTSMTWANTPNLHAFGGWDDQVNTTTTFLNLSITTAGSGARGISFVREVYSGTGYPVTTVSNCVFDTKGAGIYLSGKSMGTSGGPMSPVCTVTRTLFRSDDIGIFLGPWGDGTANGKLTLVNSRIEAKTSGFAVLRGPSQYTPKDPRSTVVVERSEIICTSSTPSSSSTGIKVMGGQTTVSPLIVVSTLVAGFQTGISDEEPDGAGRRHLLNNTIIGTGSSTGLTVRAGDRYNNKGGNHYAMLVNNIFANHAVGVRGSGYTGYTAMTLTFQGDNNAYFANTTNRLAQSVPSCTVTFSDANRVEPAYTLAQAFVDPNNGTLSLRDYHLSGSAKALLHAGEEFSASALGGIIKFIDYNNNSSYQDGADYVISLDGGTATGGTRLVLDDAGYYTSRTRFQKPTLDIGAYEFLPPQGTLVIFK